MEEIDILISQIRKKKELSTVSEPVIRQSIVDWTKSFSNGLMPRGEKEKKILIKEVRAVLRKLVGRFSPDLPSESSFSDSSINSLLNTHSSTKERISIYPWLHEIINSLNILHISDLGCGINPLALADKKRLYDSIDIQESSLNIVRKFYAFKGIKGKVKSIDLRNISQDDVPNSDLALILKVLDVLDSKGHKNAERLIKLIPSKYLLVSFSTKTLSGRPMNHPQRGWIERLSERLGYSFKCFKKENEIFYLLQKLSK